MDSKKMPQSLLSTSSPDLAVALFDDEGRTYSYGDLRGLADQVKVLKIDGLVLVFIKNQIDSIAGYLAFVQAGVPVMLVGDEVDSSYKEKLIESYSPRYLLSSSEISSRYQVLDLSFGDWQLFKRENGASEVNDSLGLMLGTSGSTGSPKFVRLSHMAIRANANDIMEALNIQSTDTAITCLPCSYSYGLSIVNSHVAAGSRILVSDSSIVNKDFWRMVEEHCVTSFAGVPTTYKLLRQMRWSPSGDLSIKYMTQAGGRLHDVDREYFINMLSPFGIEFIVMYGQTEATARITICPPELLKMNISSAGVPIPNGEIQIRESNSEGIGRVVYVGKNVMMGYATSGSDLPRGDDLNGVLETGDLGYILDGALFLTGREKRIVKIFGARVSLDDVDEWLAEFGNGASIQGNDRIEIFFETESIDAHEVKRVISQRLGVHSSGVNVNIIDEIPLLRNQKIDTQALSELIK